VSSREIVEMIKARNFWWWRNRAAG